MKTITKINLRKLFIQYHNPLWSKIKLLIRGKLNPILLNITKTKDYNISNSLIITGAPRSGTTWLAELINTIPNSAILFEPLSLAKCSIAKQAGMQEDMYFPPNAHWAEGKEYFSKVLAGKILNQWTTSHIPINKVFNIQHWIIKMVRGNMLLGWLTNQSQFRPPILIIRHPCATIASQLMKGWLPPTHPPLNNDYINNNLHLREICKDLNTPEEILAAWWCIRYHAPLSLSYPRPFVLISYEKLVTNGVDEMSRIFSRWDINFPGAIVKQLNIPSKTTASYSQIAKGVKYNKLSGWKNLLNKKQQENILRVVHSFGIKFYNYQVEPDYSQLYSSTPLAKY